MYRAVVSKILQPLEKKGQMKSCLMWNTITFSRALCCDDDGDDGSALHTTQLSDQHQSRYSWNTRPQDSIISHSDILQDVSTFQIVSCWKWVHEFQTTLPLYPTTSFDNYAVTLLVSHVGTKLRLKGNGFGFSRGLPTQQVCQLFFIGSFYKLVVSVKSITKNTLWTCVVLRLG